MPTSHPFRAVGGHERPGKGGVLLNHAKAKEIYDRFGARQDRQVFYEAPAFAALLQQAQWEQAQAVFEFGCGTGNFAATLLAQYLPTQALYIGMDQSTTMVQLAAARLASYRRRSTVVLSDGSMNLPVADQSLDRLVANYVLDLLSEEDIRAFISEAQRVLRPEGLLCLTSLTHGDTLLSQWVMGLWQQIYERNPERLGGCRPLNLRLFLDPTQWQLHHVQTLITWGLASELIVVAPNSLGRAKV
jgi:ubiquinone/menaquinone biosynthesis C-methylase UbiE